MENETPKTLSEMFKGAPQSMIDGVISTPFRNQYLLHETICSDKILLNRQPLVRLSWHMADFIRSFFDENIPRVTYDQIDLYRISIRKDKEYAKQCDTELLKNAAIGALFHILWESFSASVRNAENGKIVAARGLLRLSLESAVRIAVLKSHPDKIIKMLISDDIPMNQAPQSDSLPAVQLMKKYFSESAAHSTFATSILGLHSLHVDEYDKFSLRQVDSCYCDIFDSFFYIRDTLFELFGREHSKRIVRLHKHIRAVMTEIKYSIPYFAELKAAKDAQKSAQ
jgi:hypothetical protein